MEYACGGGTPAFSGGQVCRTCLADAADAFSWHETVSQHGYTTTVLHMLVFLGFIVANEEKEEYPDTVCQSCISKLMISYQFKLTCADASAMLASLPPPRELPINFADLTDLEIIQLDHGYDLPFPNFNPEEAIDHLHLDSEDDQEIENITKSYSVAKRKIGELKEMRLYSCNAPFCNKVYSRQSNLREHLATHRDSREHLCIECGKGFHSRSLLRQHLQTHSTERKHACTMCHKSYQTKQRLKEHIRVAHTVNRQPFKCVNCDKSFTAKSTLVAHTKTHMGRKDYKCDACPKSFTRAAYLKLHKLKHTGAERPKVFRCTYEGCSRSFGTRYSANVHLAHAHNTDRYFECEICQKKFVTNSGLRQHKEIHNKEPHVTCKMCKYCGKALSSKRMLRKHLQLHLDTTVKVETT